MQDSVAVPVKVPAPGEGKRGEAGYLSYLLRQAAAAVRLRLERTLVGLAVTPPQFLVLTMLDSYPGASGADIARLAQLTPQTVHGIIGNLERARLIGRSPHPVHGRVQVIALTKSGPHIVVALQGARGQSRRHFADDEAVIGRWLVGLATRGE